MRKIISLVLVFRMLTVVVLLSACGGGGSNGGNGGGTNDPLDGVLNGVWETREWRTGTGQIFQPTRITIQGTSFTISGDIERYYNSNRGNWSWGDAEFVPPTRLQPFCDILPRSGKSTVAVHICGEDGRRNCIEGIAAQRAMGLDPMQTEEDTASNIEARYAEDKLCVFREELSGTFSVSEDGRIEFFFNDTTDIIVAQLAYTANTIDLDRTRFTRVQ